MMFCDTLAHESTREALLQGLVSWTCSCINPQIQ